MGYYNSNGVVGAYNGKDVFVIGYKDFKKETIYDNRTIYAVRCNNKSNLDLVYEGRLIGEMGDNGRVNIFPGNKQRDYKFYKVKESEPKTEAEVEGYEKYSVVVDKFFKDLDKLWEELDQF